MQVTVTPQQRQAAKREIVRQMKQGASTHEARVRSIVPMHRTTVYRLLKRVQSEGESALVERRHGHPVKLRGEALIFLKEYCQSHPSAPSSGVQRLLSERFGLSIPVLMAQNALRMLSPPGQRTCGMPQWKERGKWEKPNTSTR